jgi:hypothetical protein
MPTQIVWEKLLGASEGAGSAVVSMRADGSLEVDTGRALFVLQKSEVRDLVETFISQHGRPLRS